jgi:protein phosphatase
LLDYIIAKRLKNKRLTVVYATSVQKESRNIPIAIVLDIPEQICQDRHKVRQDRNFEDYVISSFFQFIKRLHQGLRYKKTTVRSIISH